MRFGQHAQRAGDQQMPAFGLGAASLLIDQEAVGVDSEGKRNGRILAGIEKPEGRIGGRVRPDLTPLRRLRDPSAPRVLRCR